MRPASKHPKRRRRAWSPPRSISYFRSARKIGCFRDTGCRELRSSLLPLNHQQAARLCGEHASHLQAMNCTALCVRGWYVCTRICRPLFGMPCLLRLVKGLIYKASPPLLLSAPAVEAGALYHVQRLRNSAESRIWEMALRSLSVSSHKPSVLCVTSSLPFIVLLRTALMLLVKLVAFVTTPASLRASAMSAVAMGIPAVLSKSRIAHSSHAICLLTHESFCSIMNQND